LLIQYPALKRPFNPRRDDMQEDPRNMAEYIEERLIEIGRSL
jgi:hypothetical protein